MTFRELAIKSDYLSEVDDLVDDFYIPVLSESVAYDRIAGYFNSGSLAAASSGIAGFVRNGGKMRLLCSPQLSSGDLLELLRLESDKEWEDFVDARILSALDDFENLQELLLRDHVRALSWMLKNGTLDIKFAVPVVNTSPLMHVKMGILSDADGNSILFKGSINETGAGWTVNSEQFDVWTSWEHSTKLEHNQQLFESYWRNLFNNPRFKILGLSDAVRQRLLSFAPVRFEDLKLTRNDGSRQKQVELRSYQEDALFAWVAAGRRGILEMATGAGKTRTAHACIQQTMAGGDRIFTVVTAPYAHIADQWMSELKEFDPMPIPGNGKWKDRLATLVSEVKLGISQNAVVVAVQNTAANMGFTEIMETLVGSSVRLLFIGDECHGLGAPTFQNALLDSYDYRLGLSATPERYMDEAGTTALRDFFGETVYSFPLENALALKDPVTGQTYLCPYAYEFESVSLDDEELSRYKELTAKAAAANGGRGLDGQISDNAKLILIQRARVVKKARAKIGALRSKINSIPKVEHTLIYCEDTEQLADVMELLDEMSIRYHRFTGSEGTKPDSQYGGVSERESLIRSLADGTVQVLVAIKCLDEGVDVPSARYAYILASSGNAREFIQRRGRVLRRTSGKELAHIVDFIVVPQLDGGNYDEAERKVFLSECSRLRELCVSAQNRLSVEVKLSRLLAKFEV